VGTASIKEAVIVGGSALLIFGKETIFTKASTGMIVIWKTLKD